MEILQFFTTSHVNQINVDYPRTEAYTGLANVRAKILLKTQKLHFEQKKKNYLSNALSSSFFTNY